MSSSNAPLVRSLFEGAAPRYDGVVRVATVGMDVLWKRRLFAAIPADRSYDRVLDLACGTGLVTFRLARRYPEATVVGLDVSPDMLSVARARNDRGNVRFVEKPAEEMADLGPGSFDLLTASYLPKYTDVRELAADTATVLGDDGVAVFHDFTYPRSRTNAALFEAYVAVLRRVLPYVPGYAEIATELRDLIVDAAGWPEELRTALRRAGVDHVRVDRQPLGVAAIVSAAYGGRPDP